MRVIKKPIIVDAWQLDVTEIDFAPVWARKAFVREDITWDNDAYCWKIKTLEGRMTAYENDYLIRGVRGELYPCERTIFEETYEIVE